MHRPVPDAVDILDMLETYMMGVFDRSHGRPGKLERILRTTS
jgi:hypothetical protein